MPLRSAICLIVNVASVFAMAISLIMPLMRFHLTLSGFMLYIFPLAAGNSRFLDPLEDTEASVKYLERSKSRGFQEVLGLLLRIPYYRAYISHDVSQDTFRFSLRKLS